MVREQAGRFDGAVAVVTGGAHGIGRACAVRLAAEGARVAVLDVDEQAAQDVVLQLPGSDQRKHLALRVDVTDTSSVEDATARVVDTHGQIDTLVNVAGGDTAHGGFEDTDDALWARLFELNLFGVVRCCRAVIPHLRRSSHHPAIVTISSVNGLVSLGSEAYSAAKAGLTSLTGNLAADLGPEGIRVNAVAPGTIRTRVWDTQEGGADKMLPLYPLGRVGEPEDIAAAVAFLASSDAAWITGHTLPVDGGLLTGRREPVVRPPSPSR
jgi:NAD(P)-dependent dehydrogenase (short-subunit alcohol dehydrogenase family)